MGTSYEEFHAKKKKKTKDLDHSKIRLKIHLTKN